MSSADNKKKAAASTAAASTTANGGGPSPSGASKDTNATASTPSASSHDPNNNSCAPSLINLEVKVLTQALGAENQWIERGDGRVEFTDLTIRVVALNAKVPTPAPSSSNGNGNNNNNNRVGGRQVNKSPDPSIILEDTITNETPFVGENCCIVWNSFEQQLSLCLMYSSEEGYAASWSALVALQDKAYPPFRVDLLRPCVPDADKSDLEDSKMQSSSSRSLPPGILPYSYFIHNKYDPPLGFIEQHALSLCIMEHAHSSRAELYADKRTTITLLQIASPDLVEHLLTNKIFPLLVKGLGSDLESDSSWQVPTGLANLKVPDELSNLITKDVRLSRMQELRLSVDGTATNTELLMKLNNISHRVRNELTCSLLSSDATLTQAREALMIVPPAAPAPVRNRAPSFDPSASITSIVSEASRASANSSATGTSAAMEAGQRAEQQVLSHLRFFRNLVSLSMSELGRELVGPVVLKIYQGGLLEALSLVAERFAMPCGAAAAYLAGLTAGSGSRSSKAAAAAAAAAAATPTSPNSGRNWYSPAISQELALLLDATLVRLNERQEEQLMNEIVRSPILADTAKYNGLLTFMVRQLVLDITGRPRGVAHDRMSRHNPLLLFHVLGLHDDEGSSATERALDPENTDIRNRFHNLVITKYLTQAARHIPVPVPQPPSSTRNNASAPIIQFNATAMQNIPQSMSASFIRVFTYLVELSSTDNREALLRMIFHSKSRVMQFVESCCEAIDENAKAVGSDVLCQNVRLIKAILTHAIHDDVEPSHNPMAIFAAPPEPLSPALVTSICRSLTVERGTLGIILHSYTKTGGARRNSPFHSSVLSLLELIDQRSQSRDGHHDSGNNNNNNNNNANSSGGLHNIRDYLFLKHADTLPARYSERFRAALLAEVSRRLGGATHTPLESASVLSSTAGSEMLRSSSRLRFVDEVEAATGGVDGTVVPETVTNLSPEVVASVQHSEDKFGRRRRRTMDQWSPTASSRSSDGISSTATSSSTSSTSSNGPSSKDGGAAAARKNQSDTAASVKPSAPTSEKPAVRPRSRGSPQTTSGGGSHTTTESNGASPPPQITISSAAAGRSESVPNTQAAARPTAGSKSVEPQPSPSSPGTAPVTAATPSTAGRGAGGDAAVMLPKIRKRATGTTAAKK